MSGRQDDEEATEPSRLAGGCVLVVLGGGAVAAVVAIAPAAGLLVLWGVGAGILWWAVRRPVSDSSATPPPLPKTPLSDVYAGETDEIDWVERGPEGVVCIIHPKRVTVQPEP